VPAGAKTIDPQRVKEAMPSRPVLPQRHPLLEANPISYRGTWVRKYESLKVFGPTVSVVDNDGQLLVDVSVEWGRKGEEHWTFRRLALPFPKLIPGKTLVLVSTGGDTYFHWMTDVLPRIRIVQQAGYDLATFDHFLINGLDQPFQKETLRALNIATERCLTFSGRSKAFRLEEAILPSLPGMPGVVPPETVEFLQGTISVKKTGSGRKIFIGRGGANHRQLIHEKEIASHLLKMGFETVGCGKLSVEEQADRFCSANIVVGAHGAALTNLVFCRPGTKVVELFSPHYVNPCYRDLSVAAGLKHSAVIGDGKDWVLSEKHDQPSAPITASWELVEEALGKLNC
jgi:capsular polysaccharide biosynthesis protein